MIIESLFTTFLKHRFEKDLQLTSGSGFSPPTPEPGKTYLLYAHIPFCEELCPYCSFNRYPLDRDLGKQYLAALTKEIRIYADMGFDFSSVYVGGGTPTVLPQEMGRMLDDIRELFGVCEISLETNPNHLTDPIIEILKDSGVNRLSVGVQSFDNNLLKLMERYHKYGSAEKIEERLAGIMGVFDTLNVDMIFNFPTQTMEMIDKDLDVIQRIEADQVTFYPLMVSDITKDELAQRFGPISYRTEQLFYHRIADRLASDYSNGTAWCFSRQNSMIDEYIIEHDEYVGAGSGAFGYVNGSVIADTFSLEEYLDSLNHSRLPIMASKDFTLRERIRYEFMMKLFGTALDIKAAEKKFDGAFMRTLRKEIAVFKLIGALVNDNDVLRLTQKGRYFWVIMMREFFTGVNNFRDTCRAAVA